ncbi:hypothetical protein H4219_005673 [Mycoemilia scoparia]|uniref:WLM domain-containing protein n=1 Tax=Mycoemilia scoparia TaxID=417184 RepID=A0A9W8DP20_9FUNG|nr:hypothetical protein H4219_005673 [Mycoemilia scoparia]
MSGIGETSIVEGLPNTERATQILNAVVQEIKPTLRKFNWYIGTFREFYPNEGDLLGLNTNFGEMIQIRFRYPGNPNRFFTYDEIMDVTLHELAHIEQGNHGDGFNGLNLRLRQMHGAHRFKSDYYQSPRFRGRGLEADHQEGEGGGGGCGRPDCPDCNGGGHGGGYGGGCGRPDCPDCNGGGRGGGYGGGDNDDYSSDDDYPPYGRGGGGDGGCGRPGCPDCNGGRGGDFGRDFGPAEDDLLITNGIIDQFLRDGGGFSGDGFLGHGGGFPAGGLLSRIRRGGGGGFGGGFPGSFGGFGGF